MVKKDEKKTARDKPKGKKVVVSRKSNSGTNGGKAARSVQGKKAGGSAEKKKSAEKTDASTERTTERTTDKSNGKKTKKKGPIATSKKRASAEKKNSKERVSKSREKTRDTTNETRSHENTQRSESLSCSSKNKSINGANKKRRRAEPLFPAERCKSNTAEKLKQEFEVITKVDSQDTVDGNGSGKKIKIESARASTIDVGKVMTRSYFGEVRHAVLTELQGNKYDVIIKMAPCEAGKPNPVCNELRFLMAFQQYHKDIRRGSEHILNLLEGGRTSSFVFIVLPKCGANMNQMRDDILHEEFSESTAIRLSYQATSALECLHDVGIGHGRIEPNHFVIGTRADYCTLFLIGLGRIFLLKDPEQKEWNRDMRYAPRQTKRSHADKDFECLILTILDMYCRQKLPWFRRKMDDKDTRNWKSLVLQEPKIIRIAPEMQAILMLANESRRIPPFNLLKTMLLEMLKPMKVNLDALYEWEKTETYRRMTAKIRAADEQIEYKKNASIVKEAIKKNLADYVAKTKTKGKKEGEESETEVDEA